MVLVAANPKSQQEYHKAQEAFFNTQLLRDSSDVISFEISQIQRMIRTSG